MPIETYNWLGMTPAMREWVGARQAKGFRVEGMTIANRVFEATLKVALDDMRRDKTGQIMTRVGELANRAARHPLALVAALINAGESTACYDGKNFFATDHVSGDSGTQSNLLTLDISDTGLTNAGTATAPSAAIVKLAILNAIAAMAGFLDDTGEPINEGATAYTVLVAPNLLNPALEAVTLPVLGAVDANILAMAGSRFRIDVDASARLTDTNAIHVFSNDGDVKAIFEQVEQETRIDSVAEGSELEFQHREHHYGVTRIGNVAPGFWQRAVKVNLQA